MLSNDQKHPILQLCVALTTSHYERLVKFYCNVLGIELAAEWHNDGDQALMLEMGQATLEIFDENQAEVVVRIEAGERVSGRVRHVLQVPDLRSVMERLLANVATLVREPVVTP